MIQRNLSLRPIVNKKHFLCDGRTYMQSWMDESQWTKCTTNFALLCLYSQNRMIFLKTLQLLNQSAQIKLILGLGYVLVAIIFAVWNFYFIFSDSRYKSWHLLCYLTGWTKQQQLGKAVCLSSTGCSLLSAGFWVAFREESKMHLKISQTLCAHEHFH